MWVRGTTGVLSQLPLDSVKDSARLTTLLTLRLLASIPPHVLPLEVSPHNELSVCGMGIRVRERKRNFFWVCGDFGALWSFHITLYDSKDWTENVLPTALTKELFKHVDVNSTNMSALNPGNDAEILRKPKNKSWISHFSISKNIRKVNWFIVFACRPSFKKTMTHTHL